ncbi:MAG: DegV family protein [Solirubrobacterales bacterium]|nr:DegV family protein [Solirubrobacterales bacterium]
MASVRIVTDSTHYLPQGGEHPLDFDVVSLYVNEGGETTREAEIELGPFYERLRAADDLPTTSQPSIGDFLAVYEPLLAAGQDIVSVHISGGISGTIETARQAAEECLRTYPDRQVLVVDSGTAGGGLGMIVLAAAAGARAGAAAEVVAARAEEAKRLQKIWFAVDTLEYLRRGGRIGSAAAMLGGALKIKPILTMDGEITPIERVRTAGRAYQRLIDFATELKDEGADAWMIAHIQAPDEAARLAGDITELFGHGPFCISELGPVIGSHVGPGLLAVGGVPARLLG